MEQIIQKMTEILTNPVVLTVCVAVMEMLMRVIKTDKPLSIMHVVAKTMHLVGSGVAAVADFMDKILPQNVQK